MNYSIKCIQEKIQLLCYGLRTNELVEQIYDIQNPYDLTRTGNVGLQLLIGDTNLVANVPVFNKFTQFSPFKLNNNDGKLMVENEKSGEKFPFQIIQTPRWYKNSVRNGHAAGQYVLREGTSTLICSITDSCGYVAKNMQCRFCAIGKNSNNWDESYDNRKQNILQAIRYATEDNQEIETSINLTGGNTYADDRGAARYNEFISEIRKFSSVPICIELSPPKTNDPILKLKLAGANAVMMNIEVWDEQIRAMIMPGKSQILRDRYIEAWKYAVEIFGVGNVSSVLIVGLESKESAKNAIDEMIACGVIPSIMPFRPNDGAVLENFPITNPELVFELTEYVAKKIRKSNINVVVLPGCIGCGACAAELDFLKIK